MGDSLYNSSQLYTNIEDTSIIRHSETWANIQCIADTPKDSFEYYICTFKAMYSNYYSDGNAILFVNGAYVSNPIVIAIYKLFVPVWLVFGLTVNGLSAVVMMSKGMR